MMCCRRGQEVMLDVPDPNLADERLRLGGSSFVLLEWPRLQLPPGTVDVLARYALPTSVGAIVERRVEAAGWTSCKQAQADTLRRLFEHGARWGPASSVTLRTLRRQLLGLPDDMFRAFVLALSVEGASSPDNLRELSRTPAFERRLFETRLLPSMTSRTWQNRRDAEQLAAVLLAFRPHSAAARKLTPRPSRA